MRHFLFATAAAVLAVSAPAAAQTEAERTASAALEAAPVWDGHNDVPIQLRSRLGNVINQFDFDDTLDTATDARNAMHSDLNRMRQGKVGAQWWSVYVSASLPEAEAVQATVEQIDVTKRLITRYPQDLQLALTADDVEEAMAAGRIASLLGMEGGHSIGSSLAVLRQMYDMGARYMTLTHGKTLSWADSATDAPQHDGLNAFGKDVVREMNRIGMLVDLSHVSEAAMMDALDVAQAPVIFSHSGARAVTGHLRNVPDSVLARMPENGGIVMAVALPWFITEDLRQHAAARTAERARLEALFPGLPDTVEAQLAKWDAENRAPVSTISDLADHIDHIRDVAGIDHIGIGGDYDGMPTGPIGMEDVTGYPALFVELAKRGYSQEDLEKIASRNMLRVIRGAEAYAASVTDMAPIEYPAGESRDAAD
ncbi:dipeptidase [Qipengyuania flava]|jgi:membrane dipeptidase|uniref:dipeptidase n=1 Tax=Qipengyuania flava TaxID=192812 RepID=UPI001CD3298B|nr:dipeptidase [Qipengyuania flava]MCA0891704.1 dipeptidase [Qipengyuania flava]|tara:strand:+ start:298 stop:1572 length:1275 start_codon:yes stop_codon:yes gene_type:complete